MGLVNALGWMWLGMMALLTVINVTAIIYDRLCSRQVIRRVARLERIIGLWREWYRILVEWARSNQLTLPPPPAGLEL